MAIAAIAAIMNAPATARPGLSPRASVAAAQAAGMPMPNEPTIVTVMGRKVEKAVPTNPKTRSPGKQRMVLYRFTLEWCECNKVPLASGTRSRF